MNAYGNRADKPNGDSSDLEPRTVRALSECMTVVPIGGDVFEVTTESGSSYRVDAREGRCTCPDYQHREPAGGCKHCRRVAFATGERPIPSVVDVDPLLGEHTDAEPVRVAADGGDR